LPWQVEKARDAAPAIHIDAMLAQGAPRQAELAAATARGDLWLAGDDAGPYAFLCRDDACFFARPFVALLVVAPGFRRRGLASALLAAIETEVSAPLWTSTNRSNAAMRALLAGRGYESMGEVRGLDPGDPELFFRRRKTHP